MHYKNLEGRGTCAHGRYMINHCQSHNPLLNHSTPTVTNVNNQYQTLPQGMKLFINTFITCENNLTHVFSWCQSMKCSIVLKLRSKTTSTSKITQNERNAWELALHNLTRLQLTINNAGKGSVSHASVTSTYQSHLLSSGDVLQNLFQLLLNASGPVNHSAK